jgi:hypothetical protein
MLDVGWPDPAAGSAPDRIDPQLRGELTDVVQARHGHGGLLPLLAFGYCLPLPTARNLSLAGLCHGRSLHLVSQEKA